MTRGELRAEAVRAEMEMLIEQLDEDDCCVVGDPEGRVFGEVREARARMGSGVTEAIRTLTGGAR